jgi:hypothetical protein
MSFGFDPSQMDPKALMEISKIVQQLPQDQIFKMQTLMHNMMAGHDVRREMEEFERSLPPGFKEKLGALTGAQNFGAHSNLNQNAAPSYSTPAKIHAVNDAPMDVNNARLTILQAVSERSVTPEDALKLLFPE